MSHGELPIPTTAAGLPGARELLRVWAASGKQHVSLVASVWKDPAAQGIMLVDLARHVAAAYALEEARDRDEVL